MRAFKNGFLVAIPYLNALEDRLSAVLVAMLAYPMRWIGFLAKFFERVNIASVPRGYQLIALLCIAPCFYVSNFLFKIAYTLSHRKLLRQRIHCARLCGNDGFIKFDDLDLYVRRRLEMVHALGNIESSANTANCSLHHNHVSHRKPP